MRYRWIDGAMTSHGFRFLMSGRRMERIKQNPVMLYMHKRGEVIGSWEKIEDSDAEVSAESKFDMGDDFAVKLAGKEERGFIKACSMSAIVHKAEVIDGEPVITDWEPYEVSIVDSGSSPNAVTLCNPDLSAFDAQTTIINLTVPKMEKNVLPAAVLVALGLKESASEEAALSALKTLTDENKELRVQLATQKTAQVKDLLDEAVADGRIAVTARPHYESLAAKDFDATRSIIAGLAKPVNLVSFATGGKEGDAGDDAEKLAEEFTKLDRSGRLVQLKIDNPDRYKKLFKARFGTEPSA